MATLNTDSSGNYRIRFRVAGVHAYRSLHTQHGDEAETVRRRVEETISLLRSGRICVPHGVDPVTWVLGGGRVDQRPVDNSITLSESVSRYFDSIAIGAKEPNTLATERTHLNHFVRIIGGRTAIRSIQDRDITRYAATRSREPGAAGRTVSPSTIRKELVTIGQLWSWARTDGYVDHTISRSHVSLPKKRAKLRFHTLSEINEQIARGVSAQTERDLWDSLFLCEGEISEFLDHARTHAKHSWIYPAVAFAAFTGARRSEILRAQIADVDFSVRSVQIREKKRVQDTEMSFRNVALHPRLGEILTEWVQVHPGGSFLFCSASGSEITIDQSNHHFEKTFANSKWRRMRGWHVLRHTFASVCASRGVRASTIDAWLGHMTEDMRERYRHLFPQDAESEMAKIFA